MYSTNSRFSLEDDPAETIVRPIRPTHIFLTGSGVIGLTTSAVNIGDIAYRDATENTSIIRYEFFAGQDDRPSGNFVAKGLGVRCKAVEAYQA
jgi:hypothetical protein